MPVRRKKQNSGKGMLTSVIILISLADLFAVLYLKYENLGLPFSYFNPWYIGNVLNLLFTFILICGLIIYNFRSHNGYKTGLIIIFTAIINIVLIAAIISLKIRLPLPNIYILDHPFSIIFTGLLFSLFQFLQFVFMSILWYSIVGKELFLLRAIVNSFVIAAMLFVLTFIFINIKKDTKRLSPPPRHSYKINVAVVLGAAVWSHNAPSPSLAARADKALELYRKGIVNKIQLTGSNAPGEMSEAEVAYDYLVSEGANPDDIWVEQKTVSTAEQIRFIRDSLKTKKNIDKIIIVSDGYHLTRVREICKFYKIKAGVAASDLKLEFESNLYYKLKESIALLVFWFFAL